jgi:hypothetical protein
MSKACLQNKRQWQNKPTVKWPLTEAKCTQSCFFMDNGTEHLGSTKGLLEIKNSNRNEKFKTTVGRKVEIV